MYEFQNNTCVILNMFHITGNIQRPDVVNKVLIGKREDVRNTEG